SSLKMPTIHYVQLKDVKLQQEEIILGVSPLVFNKKSVLPSMLPAVCTTNTHGLDYTMSDLNIFNSFFEGGITGIPYANRQAHRRKFGQLGPKTGNDNLESQKVNTGEASTEDGTQEVTAASWDTDFYFSLGNRVQRFSFS
ncbi:hypothetical protein ACJX0J_032469, partial [Zea mays]